MKLKEIRLKNFRCYEDITIPLDEKLTVLVAPNGMGKTAILDAISIALWDFVKKFDLAKPYPAYNISISKDDIRIVKDKTSYNENREEIEKHHRNGGMVRQLNTEIIATNTENFVWMRYKDSETAGSRTKEDRNARLLQEKVTKIQESIRNLSTHTTELPLFAYYGTGRLWNEKKLMARQKQNKNDEKIRTFAYQNSLDPASNYRQFEDWFTEKSNHLTEELMSLWEYGQHFSDLSKELNLAVSNIQNAVDIALKIVGWEKPRYSPTFKDIVLIHDEHGTLKLNQLSDGIQNVFGLVADIAYRCYLLNSHFGENATNKTEGIVLIDEVDMHLHPEWQQTILTDLQKAFPKIQFIVTTHSPQVLTTVHSECIRIIDGQSVSYAPAGSEGAESSRLLNRIFNVESRPPQNEVTKLLTEYRKLVYLDKWGNERALELRCQLDKVFQGNEPELTALDLYIDNRKWELSLEENQ